jgi:hypothetical protein
MTWGHNDPAFDRASPHPIVGSAEHKESSSMRKNRFATGVAAAALALLPLTAAAAQDGIAEIVVVHGVPGLEVDVLVNGTAAITGFKFGDVVRTTLPAGDYTFAVAATGTTTPILSTESTLSPGISATVAAFLDANGDPQLRAFPNEISATGIQPFHLANFGPVDILSGTTTVLGPVSNGQTARIDVAGGTTVPQVGIAAASSGVAALSLGDVTVPAGRLILVYAIGPNTGETLPTVRTQVVNVGVVTAVPSGTGGQTATLPLALLSVALLGSLLLAAPARRARAQA